MDRNARTVAELRPKPALALDPSMSVAEAARKMVKANADSALIVSSGAELKGILTDTDVTRKLLAPGLNPETTLVSEVMTPSPQCVRASENAVDALCTMVERRFRHLPVLDAHGAVIGVLDIAKCLYDAISRLERHLSSASTALSSAILTAMPGGHSGSSAQQMVDGLVQKLFAPSLADLLISTNTNTAAPPSIAPSESVQAAAILMSQRKSAILISSATEPCLGIVTPKDLLFRLVAKGLDGTTTNVMDVCTKSPDTMPSTATVLQALHQLQYGGYRNVPVLGERGEPLGVLDVLTLMEGALLRQQEGNALQMGGLFGSAVAGGGGVAAASAASDANHQWRGLLGASESLAGVPSANGSTSRNASRPPSQPPSRPGSVTAAPALPPAHDSSRASAVQSASGAASFLFKVNVVNGASAGSVFRIHASPDSLSGLAGAVRVKLGLEPADAANDQASDVSGPAGVTSGLVLRYDDEDNDRVVISSDEELAEAVALATRAGKDRLTLHVTVDLSSAAANASSASYVGSAAMLGNRGPSGSSLPAGGGAMDDDAKENVGSSNVGAAPRAAPGKTFAGQAAHLAGAAMSGNLSQADKATGVAVGAGAFFAALVFGAGALAGGRR